MAHRVILPKLGTNIDKATIVNWLKKEGEHVNKGDGIVEVTTDKASFELESEASGILSKIFYTNGAEVAITKTIAIISDLNEEISKLEEQVINEEKNSSVGLYAKETWQGWYSGKDSLPVKAPQTLRMSPAARKLVEYKKLDQDGLTRFFSGKDSVLDLKDISDFINQKKEKILIYGAGLGAKQALEIILKIPNIEVVGLIDDNPALKDKIICGYKILGDFNYLLDNWKNDKLSGIALSFHSEIRKKIFLKLKAKISGITIKSLIDPRAIVSDTAIVGEGVFIEAGAVVGPGTRIGNGVIVDLGAVICHDCFIGDYSHVSPGATLSGIVALKKNVLVGVGASINSTVTIGENVIITPGSAVMNDIPDNKIVSGIPAVIIGDSKRE